MMGGWAGRKRGGFSRAKKGFSYASFLMCLSLVAVAALTTAQTQYRKTLDIYVVDVEGGNATLFVAPSGESLLIDTGNGGAAAARDADRIMAAVKDAGLHADRSPDHDALARRSLRGDGRARRSHSDSRVHRSRPERAAERPRPTSSCRRPIRRLYAKAKHTVVKPGDTRADGRPRLADRGIGWRGRCKTPLPGAGQAQPVLCGLQAAGRRRDRRTRSRSAAHHVRASSGWCTSATSRGTRNST